MNAKLNTVSLPWYREPWPWILMSGPFVVVIAGLFTAYLAVISNDGLVTEDYYKQGLEVNQQTARGHQAADFGLVADVLPSDDGKHLRVFLQGAQGFIPSAEISLRFSHPTRSGVDQLIALRLDGSGFYSGEFSSPLAGRWHVALEDEKLKWRMEGEWVIEKQPSLRLQALGNGNTSAEGSVVRSDNTGR